MIQNILIGNFQNSSVFQTIIHIRSPTDLTKPSVRGAIQKKGLNTHPRPGLLMTYEQKFKFFLFIPILLFWKKKFQSIFPP